MAAHHDGNGAIGAGVLLAPVAGLAGCASSAAPGSASHAGGGTARPAQVAVVRAMPG
ncbi:hypothetical protein [Trebonia kvetii]|uniref:hypothetical protein n=1 Tax=Trebonia kvetii TaxID=2480626 RepID=UPI001652732F|nr:hypothetical protein [Trebonia kvetii]